MTYKEIILAAIDAIRDKQPCGAIGYAMDSAVVACMDAVRSVEEPFNEWIPVASYLPKTDGRFMVTVKGRRGKPHVEMRNFHGGSRTWELQCSGECVIACQPRPRPYGWKPKGDVKNVSV